MVEGYNATDIKYAAYKAAYDLTCVTVGKMEENTLTNTLEKKSDRRERTICNNFEPKILANKIKNLAGFFGKAAGSAGTNVCLWQCFEQ